MPVTVREKWRYKFENFMAKGGVSIFISLLVLFFVCLGLAILVRWLVLLIFPGVDGVHDFFKHMWTMFLAMTDPGNMGEDSDSSPWLKVTIIIAGVLGVVIFSMLIAFITTALDSLIYELRKGRSRVVEHGQTLILNWNERVLDILRELIIANESESDASVVILADRDKEEMDDDLKTHIQNPKTWSTTRSSASTAARCTFGGRTGSTSVSVNCCSAFRTGCPWGSGAPPANCWCGPRPIRCWRTATKC